MDGDVKSLLLVIHHSSYVLNNPIEGRARVELNTRIAGYSIRTT